MGFFDSIGSFAKSILTPGGTAARQGQENTQSGVAQGAAGLYNSLVPTAQNQINYGAMLEPQRQHLISQMFQFADPSRYAGMAGAIGRQATQAGLQQARTAGNQYGPNSGLAAGLTAQAVNNGTHAQNAYLAHLYDPQTQQALLEHLLGTVTQGQNPTALQNLGGLAGQVYGQPQIQVGQGLGSILGSVAGAYLGGPAGASLGGSLGGAAGGNQYSAPWTGNGGAIPGYGGQTYAY